MGKESRKGKQDDEGWALKWESEERQIGGKGGGQRWRDIS